MDYTDYYSCLHLERIHDCQVFIREAPAAIKSELRGAIGDEGFALDATIWVVEGCWEEIVVNKAGVTGKAPHQSKEIFGAHKRLNIFILRRVASGILVYWTDESISK